jgi:hypothetical protein
MLALIAATSLISLPCGVIIVAFLGRSWGYALLGITIFPLIVIVFFRRLFIEHTSRVFAFAQKVIPLPK